MKFGKEFQSQMVPEWQEAYLSYAQLKLILKDIAQYGPVKSPEVVHESSKRGALKSKGSLSRAFSGLSHR